MYTHSLIAFPFSPGIVTLRDYAAIKTNNHAHTWRHVMTSAYHQWAPLNYRLLLQKSPIPTYMQLSWYKTWCEYTKNVFVYVNIFIYMSMWIHLFVPWDWDYAAIYTHTHTNTIWHIQNVMSIRWKRHLLRHIEVTLQHTATHGNTLQHTAIHCNTRHFYRHFEVTLQHTTTHCNTLQHPATPCNTLQHPATHVTFIDTLRLHCNTRPKNVYMIVYIRKHM